MVEDELTKKTIDRRKFLKYAAIGTGVVVGGYIGINALLRALPQPRVIEPTVQPPVTTKPPVTTPTGIKSIADIQEMFLNDNKDFKHPFGMKAYMRQIEHSLIGFWGEGDPTFYKVVRDPINQVYRHQFKLYQKGERRLSFDPEAVSVSNELVQLNNLGHSQLPDTIFAYDGKTGLGQGLPERKDYVEKFFMRNVDLLPELYEETHPVLTNRKLYDEMVKDFVQEEGIERANDPEISHFPEIAKWADKYLRYVEKVGGKLEKDPMAIKSYIRNSREMADDPARRKAIVHVWSVGAVGYDGNARIPILNDKGEAIMFGDGFLGFAQSDLVLNGQLEHSYVRETQATGRWGAPQRLLESEKFRGIGVWSVHLPTPPNYGNDGFIYRRV